MFLSLTLISVADGVLTFEALDQNTYTQKGPRRTACAKYYAFKSVLGAFETKDSGNEDVGIYFYNHSR